MTAHSCSFRNKRPAGRLGQGKGRASLCFCQQGCTAMLLCHRSKAHTRSCCIMMNPQRPQIVIDSDAQLRISNNEPLSPSRVTSQPLKKLPSPTVHSHNRHSPPQPPPQLGFSLIGRGPVISAWIAWQPPSSWSNYAGSILGPLWPQEGFIRLSNWPWPDLQHLPPSLIESGRCLYTAELVSDWLAWVLGWGLPVWVSVMKNGVCLSTEPH